jgi:FkbM family methyltransferase
MAALRDSFRPLLHAVSTSAITKGPLRGLARAGILPSSFWSRMPVEETFTVELPDGKSFQYSSISPDRLARALYWGDMKDYLSGKGGVHYVEPETLQLWYGLARKAKYVLDVGANTGIFAILACVANPNSKVVAFEAVPTVYERTLNNIRINGWEGRCDVRNEAAGDRVGTARFHVPADKYSLPVSGSLLEEGLRGYAGTFIEVPVVTLDDVIGDNETVDLIKMDVENCEDKVIAGMPRILKARPDLIVEFLHDGPYKQVEPILADLGYKFWHLQEHGPVLHEHISGEETEDNQFRNYFCSVDKDPREVIAL